MKFSSENELKGILGYPEEAVVSMDFIVDKRTSIFDAKAVMMLNKNLVTVRSFLGMGMGMIMIMILIPYLCPQTISYSHIYSSYIRIA